MNELYSQLHVELQHLFGSFKNSHGILGEWISRGYALPDLEKNPILFIGLNPSYTTDPQPEDYNLYAPPVRDEYPRFFNPYQDLANACQRGDKWDYTDLFYFRETEQDKLSAVLNNPGGMDFITQQLQFTMRVFDFLRPELIVVCHPGAHQFFGVDKTRHPQDSDQHWMDYRFEFSRAFGVDVITGLHPESIQRGAKGTNLIDTPVLFTGDLNTMDASTKKRLAWQMDQIMKFREIFFTIDKDGLSKQLNRHIATIVLKIGGIEKAKNELISRGQFDAAAQFRDRSTNLRQGLLEVLMKVVGE